MTTTYGPALVPPEDIVAQINEVLPRHPTNTIPLVWGRRLAMLLAARNEILRLRAQMHEKGNQMHEKDNLLGMSQAREAWLLGRVAELEAERKAFKDGNKYEAKP